jgi:hypothetical protein
MQRIAAKAAGNSKTSFGGDQSFEYSRNAASSNCAKARKRVVHYLIDGAIAAVEHIYAFERDVVGRPFLRFETALERAERATSRLSYMA